MTTTQKFRKLLRQAYIISRLDVGCNAMVIQHPRNAQIEIRNIQDVMLSMFLVFFHHIMPDVVSWTSKLDLQCFTEHSPYDIQKDKGGRNYGIHFYFETNNPITLMRLKNGSRPDETTFYPLSYFRLE